MSVIPEPGASISMWPASILFVALVLTVLAILTAIVIRLVHDDPSTPKATRERTD